MSHTKKFYSLLILWACALFLAAPGSASAQTVSDDHAEDSDEVVKVQTNLLRVAVSVPKAGKEAVWTVTSDGVRQESFQTDTPESTPLVVTVLIDATEGVSKDRSKYSLLTDELSRAASRLRDAQVQVFVVGEEAGVIPFKWPSAWPTRHCRDLEEAKDLSVERVMRGSGSRQALLVLTTRLGEIPATIFNDFDARLTQAAAFIFVASARPQSAPEKGERFIARANLTNSHLSVTGDTNYYEPLLRFFTENVRRLYVISFRPQTELSAGRHSIAVEVTQAKTGEVVQKQVRDYTVPGTRAVALVPDQK